MPLLLPYQTRNLQAGDLCVYSAASFRVYDVGVTLRLFLTEHLETRPSERRFPELYHVMCHGRIDVDLTTGFIKTQDNFPPRQKMNFTRAVPSWRVNGTLNVDDSYEVRAFLRDCSRQFENFYEKRRHEAFVYYTATFDAMDS